MGPRGASPGLTLAAGFPIYMKDILVGSAGKECALSYQPYVPEKTDQREFTLRAILIGLVLTVILGAANAYLGLRAGMTIAATYPAAGHRHGHARAGPPPPWLGGERWPCRGRRREVAASGSRPQAREAVPRRG